MCKKQLDSPFMHAHGCTGSQEYPSKNTFYSWFVVVLAGTGGTLLGYDNGAQQLLLPLLLLQLLLLLLHRAPQVLNRVLMQGSLAVWCPCLTSRRCRCVTCAADKPGAWLTCGVGCRNSSTMCM